MERGTMGTQGEVSGEPENILNQHLPVLVQQVVSESWGNLSHYLSEWQISALGKVRNSRLGIECLLESWFRQRKDSVEGTHCNASWDNLYCWPQTTAGKTISRSCQDTFNKSEPSYAMTAKGNAYRVCLENGTWLWGNWTNYTECADSYEEFVRESKDEEKLVVRTQYILFVGSIVSLACLIPALIIFQYFRCLRCDRVNVLKQLMWALLLRYILLLVITDPVIFSGSTNYRSFDFICKAVLTVYLYATVASVNWMFIQGVYINGKLTSNVFDREAPFKLYYFIGWVLPVIILSIYGALMEIGHPVRCWKGYSEMSEIWIVALPIVFMLIASYTKLFTRKVNALFLVNIVRILMTTVQNRASSTDAGHVRRVAISMIFLVPLLGVSNLLFVYNPGGNLHKYFVTANALLGSTQGIFVALGYCFLSRDVQQVLRRTVRRFLTRVNASRTRSTVTTIRLSNRRYTRDVVGPGGLAPITYRNCLPDSAGQRQQQNCMQSHLDLFGSHVDDWSPVQNRLVQDSNINQSPTFSFGSTSSNQFNGSVMNNNDDREVRREQIFLVESEYDEKRKLSTRSVKTCTGRTCSPSRVAEGKLKRRNSDM